MMRLSRRQYHLNLFIFFFDGPGDHRPLHSFPTRRSSDLAARRRIPRGRSYRKRRSRISARLVATRTLQPDRRRLPTVGQDRKSTRLNSSHSSISYAVFCLKKKKSTRHQLFSTRSTHVQPP